MSCEQWVVGSEQWVVVRAMAYLLCSAQPRQRPVAPSRSSSRGHGGSGAGGGGGAAVAPSAK